MVKQAVSDSEQHIPVLLEPAISALNIRPNGLYLDGTYGRGGHSKQILAHLGPQGRLLAIDRDPAAVQAAMIHQADRRFTLMQGLFSQLAHYVQQQAQQPAQGGPIDGLLLDLGVSSPQLQDAQRGFSFLRDGPLDMRMNPQVGLSAAEWLAHAAFSEITEVLKNLGEERFARRIAAAIVAYRQQHALRTTRQLAELIANTVPTIEAHKHPATRSFQAIRIYLNDELTEIQQALEGALQVLAPQGRLVVISFHSLEDRIVKRFMRHQSRGEIPPPGVPLTEAQLEKGRRLRLLGKIVPSSEEIKANPRARSAVLRVAERTVQPYVC